MKKNDRVYSTVISPNLKKRVEEFASEQKPVARKKFTEKDWTALIAINLIFWLIVWFIVWVSIWGINILKALDTVL